MTYLPSYLSTIKDYEIKHFIILTDTMASFTSDISEIDVYDIKSSTGLKLSLKRRRRLSNPVNISIQPVEKRQCLTSVSSSDLSVSFQPVLARLDSKL